MILTLQPAEPSHGAYAEALARHNMAGYYQRHGIQWSDVRFLSNWAELESYLLLCGPAAAGFLSVSCDSEALYLRDIQLLPRFCNQGVGAAALAQVLALAEARGLRYVRLKVFADNPAQRLYRRLGFAEAGQEGPLLRMQYRCV